MKKCIPLSIITTMFFAIIFVFVFTLPVSAVQNEDYISMQEPVEASTEEANNSNNHEIVVPNEYTIVLAEIGATIVVIAMLISKRVNFQIVTDKIKAVLKVKSSTNSTQTKHISTANSNKTKLKKRKNKKSKKGKRKAKSKSTLKNEGVKQESIQILALKYCMALFLMILICSVVIKLISYIY